MIWRSNKYCYTSDLTNRETVATTLCERVRNLWVTWELSKSDISTKFKKIRKNRESWGKTEKFEEKLRKLKKDWKIKGKTEKVEEKLENWGKTEKVEENWGKWGKTEKVEERQRELKKNWKFRSNKFGPKILLSMFLLNWTFFCLQFLTWPPPPTTTFCVPWNSLMKNLNF